MLDMRTALLDNASMSTNIEALQRAAAIKGSAAALALAAQMTPQFMHQVLKGERPLPRKNAVLIERETGVGRKEIFPDDWQEYWPELLTPDEAK